MITGISLVVQWLRLRAPTAGGMGSIPGWGTKILHAACCGQKKKKNAVEYVNIVILRRPGIVLGV